MKSGSLSGIVYRHDVGMLEPAQRVDFALESRPIRQCGERSLLHNFDGHVAPGGMLERLIDYALSAAVDLAQGLVSRNSDLAGDPVRRRRSTSGQRAADGKAAQEPIIVSDAFQRLPARRT